ncbi:hypothetical protein [Corallococcus llansteffanensis]|uniref:hypothetical protein n=1 Tax=Corallococcus llansteffanensis TaxID=2316731 RepID=UPI000EA81CA9|nr:hypothetical protein [Corallococcus llansteffanensis]
MSVRVDTSVPRTRLPEQAPVAPPPAPAAPARTNTVDAFQQAPGGVPTGGTAAATVPPQVQQTLTNLPPGTLSPENAAALQTRLSTLSGDALTHELDFLKQNVLNTPNADRATRTYLEMKTLQDTRPGRITQSTVETLTRAVATPRSATGAAGQEGVMGPSQARDAAQALIGMTGSDYKALQGALDNAGNKNNQCIAGADVQGERALLLKAVGARREQLASPGLMDRARSVFGGTSSAMNEVTGYASRIAGSQREDLMRQSTVIDLNGGTGALQQRWNDSCAPTSQQIARAEADPVYARRLHDEPIHSTDSNTAIGREQAEALKNNGGVAVERGQAGGSGMWPEATLDTQVGRYNNHDYARNDIADTPAARQGALDRADTLLKDGIDVPIVVNWDGGGSHALMLTDVRGEGADRQYLLTDPWNGQTGWIKGSDVANGSTSFMCGTGKLSITYE